MVVLTMGRQFRTSADLIRRAEEETRRNPFLMSFARGEIAQDRPRFENWGQKIYCLSTSFPGLLASAMSAVSGSDTELMRAIMHNFDDVEEPIPHQRMLVNFLCSLGIPVPFNTTSFFPDYPQSIIDAMGNSPPAIAAAMVALEVEIGTECAMILEGLNASHKNAKLQFFKLHAVQDLDAHVTPFASIVDRYGVDEEHKVEMVAAFERVLRIKLDILGDF